MTDFGFISFGSGDGVGYDRVQDEGVNLPKQNTIDFQGAGVVASNGTGKTIVTIPGSVISQTYGSFYDTTEQAPAINTIATMEFNSVDLTCTNGISIVNNGLGKPTQITPTLSGVYNIQFSAQLDRASGGSSADADFWIAVNGAPVPWSNTRVRMQSNSRYLVAAWNWFVYLTAGQYAEIMWTQTDGIFLLAVPVAGLQPAIPSTILTVNQIY